ncbi:MAG TPA: hypothetical protein VIY49_35985 [Bryobacteraceae bacterium]
MTPSLCGQEVVFSRRVYKEQGPSYQQIWNWNPANGALQELTHSARDHYLPECKDGRITFVSPEEGKENAKLWSFDPASGEERLIGPAPVVHEPEAPKNGCVASGTLEACRQNEADLFLSRGGKQIGDFHIQAHDCLDEQGGNHGPCDTPILSLEWSPDGKWLLVGGLADAHETYYSLVDVGAMMLREVATAFPYSMIWLRGREDLLYVTPAQIGPLPGGRRQRNVWVQHLMLLNAMTGMSRSITSGLSNNEDAALCNK